MGRRTSGLDVLVEGHQVRIDQRAEDLSHLRLGREGRVDHGEAMERARRDGGPPTARVAHRGDELRVAHELRRLLLEVVPELVLQELPEDLERRLRAKLLLRM